MRDAIKILNSIIKKTEQRSRRQLEIWPAGQKVAENINAGISGSERLVRPVNTECRQILQKHDLSRR